MSDIPLEKLQRWMLSAMTHPHGVPEGIASESAQQEIPVSVQRLEEIISPSLNCSSLQRLSIYHNAYFARLIECLAAEFPSVRHAVGDDAFAGFVVSYLQSDPPSSYTLSDLGKGFADSLRRTRPHRSPHEEAHPDWADFLIELASLERLYSEVFDGPGEELLSPFDFRQLQTVPPERWPDLEIRFSRSCQQRHFQFPVHEYVTQVRNGDVVEMPAPAETFLVVFRRKYIVRRQALRPVQYRLLGELRAGFPLRRALESVLQSETEEAVSPEMLQEWFRDWTETGLLTGVELSSGSP